MTPINKPGAGAVVAAIALALACSILSYCALPFKVGAQTTITAERISPTEARICAPAGTLYERANPPAYLWLMDWPGGCDVIQTRDKFGGYVFCIGSGDFSTIVCAEPIAAWRGTPLYLPVAAR